MEERIRPETAGKILGMSGVQVRKYIRRGLLRAEKVEGTYILNRADVEAFKPPPAGRPSKPGRKRMPPLPGPIVDALNELAGTRGETMADLAARLLTDAIDAERRKRRKKK